MANEFRTFRVARKQAESQIITSFYFEPVGGCKTWDFKPGQHLTLKIPHAEGTVLKPYSLSNDASNRDFHRVSVKRETGLDGAPDGVGSCWLHDHLGVDDEIQIAAPRGSFFLDESSTHPLLLLSGGVGLTPLVSMLYRLAHSGRDVYFIHACENGHVHALRDEVLALANERIKTHFVYRNPSTADRADKRFDAEGVIDQCFLQQHVPIGNYDAYICGPTPFMVAMYQLLQELGVPGNQIAYEFFGKASSLETLAQAHTLEQEAAVHIAASCAPATTASLEFLTNPDAWAEADATAQPTDVKASASLGSDVSFSRSNKTASWDDSVHSLLELAESVGLEPDFSCRAGICSSCACRLIAGEVEYFEEPLEQPDEGEVLICCARPKGSVVLEL